MTTLVTGAAGTIGRSLAPRLAQAGLSLRLTDVTLIDEVPAGCEARSADLRDFAQVRAVTEGVAAVVHLGAIASEAPFPDIAEHNIRGSYHVLEAARRHGVARVVLASSNHVTGFYPCRHTVGPADPVKPDTFYGVSKATLEALGYLYARKHGLQVVCLRIGSFRDQPSHPRERATWLSPADAARLVRAALHAPLGEKRFLTTYGMSDNPDAWWTRHGWDTLGYQPRDTPDGDLPPPDLDDLQGGPFVDK